MPVPWRSRRPPSRPAPVVVQVDADGGVYAQAVSVRQRVAAHLSGERLDRALAAGDPPESSVLLAWRAQELTATSTRQVLASSVRRILHAAAEPPPRWHAYGPVARWDHIGAVRRELEQLVVQLLAPAPVSARGVAQVRLLLTDGTGPLYRPRSGSQLRRSVLAAVAALEPSTTWPG